jgi:hypothetical protein
MVTRSLVAASLLAALCCPRARGQAATPPATPPATQQTVSNVSAPGAGQMTLTTKSEHAGQLFGEAIVQAGNYRLDECLSDLRAAVKEDPGFAAA